VTTHGWQYATGYRYWSPLFRHLSKCCTSFVIPSAKDTGCWMNHLIEIEPPTLQSLLQRPQTHDSHMGRDPEHPSQNGAGCPVLCGRALSCSISTPQDSFSVFIGIVAACVYVSLEQPLYIWVHIIKPLKHVSNIRPLQTFMLVTVIIYPYKYIMCGDYFNYLFHFPVIFLNFL
jgi:hypothetical protein